MVLEVNGNEMTVANYACIIFGGITAVMFAYFGNMLLKVDFKKN